MMANQTMGRQIRGHANKIMLAAVGAFTLVCGSAHAVTSVTDTQCDSRLDITLAANVRSSVSSASTCQTRSLTSLAGFALTASNPANLTVNDSSALQSAGGELYESFVSGIRQAIVLLSPNHTLMMSRNLVEVTGVDWDMGLAVQPVTNGNNAYLSGTYVFLRANRDDRIVDNLHQTNAGL